MGSQQILELLLAMNFKITTKEDKVSDSEEMKAMQDMADAERKSDREEIKAMQEKAEAERKSDREEIKAMQNKADAEKE
jgi:hypothetical protein